MSVEEPALVAPVAAEPVAAPAPVSTPAPEPVSATPPIDAPTIVTPRAAALEPEPIVEVAADPVEPDPPAVNEAVEADKPAEPAATLLETEVKKPDEGDKPAEQVTQAAETAVTKTYEPFKLPEDIKVDEKALDGFREIAGKHNLDQETAQSLLDMHTSTLKDYAKNLQEKQRSDFEATKAGWVNRIKSDPVLGGANFDTAVQTAARMRDLLVPQQYRQEFLEFIRDTGAGDSIAFMRILHTAARLFDEPAAPPVPARPVADRGGAAKKSRAEVMYDNPTSRRAAGRG